MRFHLRWKPLKTQGRVFDSNCQEQHDRGGPFEPLLFPKHERRFTGFDDKIINMCARDIAVREVCGVLVDRYGVDVSPECIGIVTDAVMAEVVQ